MDMEPIPVGGGCSVFHHVMERPEPAAAVVENTIKNDPHAPLMHSADQCIECRIAAQEGIHLEVVVGVVAVIGG